MAAKKFVIPFASTGDKAPVPNALQPDGTVSYAQGFGPDYELDKTVDPVNAKDVPRDQTNQLYFDLTDAVGEQQLYGVALWGSDRAPYPLNARAYHSNKLWRSNIANNNDEPGISVTWDDVSSQPVDYLNTTRIDVPSSASVNLTAEAPNTRHINITGTASINNFIVSSGSCYFVTFASALTLINGASLVTGSGANIAVSALDTCVIYATAANTVQVMYYTRASDSKSRCTAWVNFNGTGTPAIRDSFNVSSIVDNGVGDYTVNFTTPFDNTNYCCLPTYTNGTSTPYAPEMLRSNILVGSVRISQLGSVNGPAAGSDWANCNVAIFGGKL